MSRPGASSGGISGFPLPREPASGLSEPLLDALLAGQPGYPDAPDQARAVAAMLASLTGPADPGELAGEAAARFAFAQAVSPAGGPPADGPPAAGRSKRRRPRRLPVPLTARLAAALLVAATGLGGAAAAYADALPGPIQELAHRTIGAPGAGHASSRLPAVRPASRPCAARQRADTYGQPGTSAAAFPAVAGAARGGAKVVAQCAGKPGPGAGPAGRPGDPDQLQRHSTSAPGRIKGHGKPAPPGQLKSHGNPAPPGQLKSHGNPAPPGQLKSHGNPAPPGQLKSQPQPPALPSAGHGQPKPSGQPDASG